MQPASVSEPVARRHDDTTRLLLACAAVSACLYWLLWTPTYRLSERFEYGDFLFWIYPWLPGILAAQVAAVGRILPSVVGSYESSRVLFAGSWVALFALYGLSLALLWRGESRRAVGAVLGTTLLYQLLLWPMPGIISTDLFSYTFYGQVAGAGGSPYLATPDDAASDLLYLLINPLWRDAPSVYGPIWSALSAAVGAVWHEDVFGQVLSYRLLADAVHWCNLGLLARALRYYRPGGLAFGLALYAWNPLVVFEFGGSGHNDGVLIAFVLLSLGLCATHRRAAALLALLCSVATKYTTILLMPAYIWWATRDLPLRRRLLVGSALGAAGGALLIAAYLPWWRGPGTFGPIIYWISTPLYAHHAPYGLALHLRDFLAAMNWLSWDDAENFSLAVVRWSTRLAFAAYLLWESLRLRRTGELPLASARILLIFLLGVNTWVLSWYYTWPLAVAALGDPRARTTALAVALTATAPISMYWAQTHFENMDTSGYVLYLAPVGLLLAWETWRRQRWWLRVRRAR